MLGSSNCNWRVEGNRLHRHRTKVDGAKKKKGSHSRGYTYSDSAIDLQLLCRSFDSLKTGVQGGVEQFLYTAAYVSCRVLSYRLIDQLHQSGESTPQPTYQRLHLPVSKRHNMKPSPLPPFTPITTPPFPSKPTKATQPHTHPPPQTPHHSPHSHYHHSRSPRPRSSSRCPRPRPHSTASSPPSSPGTIPPPRP